MLPRLVIALTATGIVATAVGCSHAPNPHAAPSAPGASPTVTASTAPENTSSPTGSTAAANFVGHWRVHGASLTITDTTATIFAAGACRPAPAFCSETDTMAVQSGDDTHLTLVVTAVRYADASGASVPNPDPGPSTSAGDTTQIVWQAPGLLKQSVLHGFPGWEGGNPYWCGAGISEVNNRLCGA